MNNDWLENEDLKFVLQMDNFATKLPTYAVTLGLLPADVAANKADSDFVRFAILGKTRADEYKQDWTKLKDQVRYGIGGNVLGPFPLAVDVTTPPPAVAVGVEERFRALVKRIKAHPNYTKGIGETLGIEAPVSSTDPILGKPTFKIYIDSSHPVLKWVKGAFQGVEIWADHADGKGWVKQERDFHSPYADKHPLPAVGTSAVWKYKMIYLIKDETIGEWSGDTTVTVYGSV